MQTNARQSLTECLDSLTRDENPPLNGLLMVEYIVLRRVNVRKDYVYVEFVDGDLKDGNEWSEGPVPEYMTIRELFRMKDGMDRGARREMYGRRKLGDEEVSNLLANNECEYAEREESSDGNDMVDVHAVGSGRVDRVSSEDAGKNVSSDSSSAAPRSSTGTRRRASCEIGAKRAKTCLDAGNRDLRIADEEKAETCAIVEKSKVGGVVRPKPDFLVMATKSASGEGMKPSECAE
jgi:hypothetical protein